MGIQYGNITLRRVDRDELVDYLSEINLDAYVSPTVNGFTTVYDKGELTKLRKLNSRSKTILRQYQYDPQASLVCLASHISERFTCSAIAIFIYDGSIFWYHVCKNGVMLDEYTTCGDNNWQSSQIINITGNQIKGGDARKLCTVFEIEKALEEVEIILRKPDGSDDETLLNLPRYEALLQVESYCSPLIRHEALARALGMRPCWVVGPADYRGIVCRDMEVCFEFEDDDPSFEEALLMLKKTKIFEEMKETSKPFWKKAWLN
ncbi:hypothetical protein [Argonema antarcticum]|uniref:hypothetical protein n=1 Tax=Argonema antarcticum TaxID=2942763 RepID=UPI002012FCB4|nr:hypothetical protein [Argonema antarcticum]MCL1473077.1 hypothetical protein [Argonema antarcticum A004/B2]